MSVALQVFGNKPKHLSNGKFQQIPKNYSTLQLQKHKFSTKQGCLTQSLTSCSSRPGWFIHPTRQRFHILQDRTRKLLSNGAILRAMNLTGPKSPVFERTHIFSRNWAMHSANTCSFVFYTHPLQTFKNKKIQLKEICAIMDFKCTNIKVTTKETALLCNGSLFYKIWSQRNIMRIWEKVSEQQQRRGWAAWRIRLEDRGCCCSYSLTDETGKSSGHIHILIEKGLSSWQIASDHTLPGSYVSHTLLWTEIHTLTLWKGQNFKSVRFLISCRVSKPVPPNLWW